MSSCGSGSYNYCGSGSYNYCGSRSYRSSCCGKGYKSSCCDSSSDSDSDCHSSYYYTKYKRYSEKYLPCHSTITTHEIKDDIKHNSEPPKPVTLPEVKKEDVTKTASENMDCSICMSSRINIVFIPCWHASCCNDCAALLEDKGDPCPICRSKIEKMQKLYFS